MKHAFYSAISFTVFMTALLFFPPSAMAKEKMRIAIMDLQGKNTSAAVTGTITSLIRTEIVNSGQFTVVERAQIDQIIKEQGLQMTGCTDQACAVEVGRLLSARMMLLGEVNTVGKSIIITIRIVDVERGTSDFAADETATQETIRAASKTIARKLAGMIQVKIDADMSRASKTNTGYYLRGLVPGWGQLYAEQPVKGYAFIGAFAASGGFLGYALYNYTQKRSEYEDLGAGTPTAVFNEKYDASQKAATMAWIATGVFSFVYVANIIDIVFFSKPDFRNDPNQTGLVIDNSTDFIISSLSRTIPESVEDSLVLGITRRF
jgi:TolB-like protein